MKKTVFTSITVVYTILLFGQQPMDKEDSVASYFAEVMLAAKKNKNLWDMDLYGPILIVDPFTRKIFANYPDTSGVLKSEGDIYTGKLPNNILLGNYSLNWGGRKWAMVLTLFITNDKAERIELFSHELFHRVQEKLNFARANDLNNQHLDKEDGRIYLRLELEALTKALNAANKNETIRHLTDALKFRLYRYKLFPNAHASEASIEINEGVASYTGKIFRGLNHKEVADLMSVKIKEFYMQPSYVQMFAYQTVPAYGFLLRRTDKYWNKKIHSGINLTDHFTSSFKLKDKLVPEINIDSLANFYNGVTIKKEEAKRDDSIKIIVDAYKTKFIEDAFFEIAFEKKSISYDTRYIVTIDELGFVYPTMKAIDKWGVLDIKDVGGLLSPNKDKVRITIPTKIDGNNISGDGWTLLLNEGYIVVKDENSGNYKLLKK